MFYINAQSLLCHKHEIELLVTQHKIDVLCISETWLSSNMSDGFANIPSYNLYREDHDRDSLRDVVLRNKPIFIFGDFNDDLLKAGNKMAGLIDSVKLDQLIDRPTRVTSNSSTLIDLFITNNKTMVTKLEILPGPIADHEAISILVNMKKLKRSPIYKTFRCLRNYSQNTYCNLLLNEVNTLNTILHTDDVSIQVNTLTNVMNLCIDTCAPIVTRQLLRPPAPWISEQIRSAIKERDQTQSSLKQDPYNELLRENYRDKKKTVELVIDASRKEYYNNEFKKNINDISATWKTAKKMLSNVTNNDFELIENSEAILTKTENVNEFFSGVGKRTFEKAQEDLANNDILLQEINHSDNFNDNLSVFRPSPVDCETVILTIKSMKETNASGPDGISLRFIKDSLFITAFYLTIIINTSIVTNVYPEMWKIPYVVPVYKSGDKDLVVDYLPHCFVVQYADDTQILIEGDSNDVEAIVERANNILSFKKMLLIFISIFKSVMMC
ncbi:uncharacterized protein [Palaemon carinicauda]|uniref:uncharacterized protein n=1 Tax=Palaemon carinicauda TaxID=392227 RepID=UPI0035B6A459